MPKTTDVNVGNAVSDVAQEVDTDFVAWMTAHEESVRQAWFYNDIYAVEHSSLMIEAFVLAGGVVIEHWDLFGFGSKWTKRKSQTETTFEGFPLEGMKEAYPDAVFVARRASNRITGEVIYYRK